MSHMNAPLDSLNLKHCNVKKFFISSEYPKFLPQQCAGEPKKVRNFNMTSLEDGLKILFDEIDENCKITNFESVVAEDDFSVILRTKLTNCDNNWGQVCNKWVEKFTNQTNSKWIVKATYPTVHRMEYRKLFICKENRIANRNQNKFCKSKIDIKVKKVTKNTLKSDLLLKSGYNGVIKVIFSHSHPR